MRKRISFALEYSLGHITHAENLKAALTAESTVAPTYFDIPFDNTPLPFPWSALPAIRNNWTARASIVAYLAIKSTMKTADAAFFHTQVTSIFSAGLMKRLPSVVSLDATPLQYDSLGDVYNHERGSSFLEGIKKNLNEKAFRAAKRIVTWSQWTKDSLANDYGVSRDKVTVIPPGIDLEKWLFPRRQTDRKDVNFLFVGGHFSRKGGPTLLAAFEEVSSAYPACSLDIVTKQSDFSDLPANVRIHNGLTANSQSLMSLYEKADVFVFPTLGDCLPLAIMEALAAGLPIICTNVGALSEAVEDGISGYIVAVNDAHALALAMMHLVTNPVERLNMGLRGRDRAQLSFDSRKNYGDLVTLVEGIAQ
jgi:glycosyltransferase involved in cell wall biosynthesis